MTEGNPYPDEEQHVAHSRRTDEAGAADTDDELAPPFVPGGTPADPAEPARQPDERDAGPAWSEPDGDAADAFPFEDGWADDVDDAGVGIEAGEEDDDFPFEAFDIGDGPGTADTGTQDAYGAETGLPPLSGSAEASSPDVDVVADRLEAMALRIRREGPGGAEAEMGSSDRFTTLLASLVAGYLAGRG